VTFFDVRSQNQRFLVVNPKMDASLKSKRKVAEKAYEKNNVQYVGLRTCIAKFFHDGFGKD
jgi:hypothetical protein